MYKSVGIMRYGRLATFISGIALGSIAFGQTFVRGDVDSNGVVTCRDVAMANRALQSVPGDPAFLLRADINGNGRIDQGDVEAIRALLPAGALCDGMPTYLIILGHDGSPDPDDNLAQLAGFMQLKRAMQRDPRVALAGMVFGDVTTARKATMVSGTDVVSRANWDFHREYTVPALFELGLTPETHADAITETWNYDAASRDQLTSAGRLIFDYVKAAIDANGLERVVYTAGGGHHSSAEAIGLLRKQGYSDQQILDHFALVQHSRINWTTLTEVGPARPVTFPFTIRIDDQNGTSTAGPNFRPRSGSNFPPISVSPSCTSPAFAIAWHAATVGGAAESGIPNHQARNDASDAGEAAFSSTPAIIDQYWYTRSVGLSLTIDPNLTAACNTPANQAECIVYDKFSTAEMNASMNCVADLSGFALGIASPPALNSAKAGSAAPLSFTASMFEGRLISNIVSVSSEPISCESGESLDDPQQAIAAGASGAQYNATTAKYLFTWKTDTNWANSCRQLRVQRDGVVRVANFQFR